MKKSILFPFIILLVILSGTEAIAQQKIIDSLLTLLKKENSDTLMVNHLNSLCWEYKNAGKYDSALYYCNQAIKEAGLIAQKSKGSPVVQKTLLRQKSQAFNNIGNVHSSRGENAKALENYFKALKIAEECGNKNAVSSRLGNIGIIYYNRGDFPKALEYYFKALKIAEEVGEKNKIIANLSNIGVVYLDQKNYPKSLEYYFKALKISEETGDKNKMAVMLSNIGIIYENQGEYSKALEYYFKALKINEELENELGMAYCLGNIGVAYKDLGNYQKALEYYLKALKTDEKIGNKNGVARHLGNIGSAYLKQKKYNEAEKYLLPAIEIFTEIGALNFMMEAHQNLSELYFEKGDYKKAYFHHNKYTIAKDSIFNMEKDKDITRKEMNYEFEKKEAAAKAEHEKEMVIAEADKKRQRMIIWSTIFGLMFTLIFAGFIFRSLKITRKQKKTIEIKSKETEEQKMIIEEKNKDITDSIQYAKLIQQAILPAGSFVNSLLPGNFIFYKPKDIVAGDFYFVEENEGKIFFAAADCTGHGVPGAMVSVVCSNALTRAVKEFGLSDAGKILDKTRDLVLETLAKNENNVKDGMDISFCCLDKKSKILNWAGANNPLWIARPAIEKEVNKSQENNYELLEIKPDKQPIGQHQEIRPFTSHNISLQKGDSIYLFTDGYADQFGGEKGKKFKYAKLKELLLSITDKSLHEQKEILNETFEAWRGNLEQVDDVCVIGVKV